MATLLDHRFATVPPPPSIEETQVENVLDSSHQGYFYRAIRDILHTCIAETTFAQIIDGLPLKSVAHATAGLSWESSLNNDENLCAGSLEMLNGFRGRFEPLKMKLSLETLRRYQKTPPGSSEWTLPLIELVAVAIHRIVVLLYKAKNPDIHSCIRMDRICSTTACGKTTFHPTPFCLPQYGNPNQYPEGVAELPRYWAEDRIFGGVVISGRGESGVECNNFWLPPSRKGITHRVCAVTEDQLARLSQFLGSDNPVYEKQCPLPILVDKTKRRRVDHEIAIPEHSIYRDRWERRMRFRNFENYDFYRGGLCVIDEVDYPGGVWEYLTQKDTAAQIGARNVDLPL